MILYDADDKLCVASENTIRLWDFYDTREVPPELWASHEFTNETIQKVYLNEHGKGDFVFIVVTDRQCYVFEERLTLRAHINLSTEHGRVTAVAFNQESTQAYLGTSNGYVISWDLNEGKADSEPMLISQDK